MKILMVDPKHFDITYSINSFMTKSDGSLQTIDKKKASNQWHELKRVFESLQVEVEIIPSQEKLPDMVFCCNHGLALNKKVLLSRMTYSQRRGEPFLFKDWYHKNNFEVIDPSIFGEDPFEGCGDAIPSEDRQVIFGGYGFRTSRGAYEQVQKVFPEVKVIPIKLVDETFYHLDTCFVVLGHDVAALVESAIDKESVKRIKEYFRKTISISESEASQFMAANAFFLDKNDVVLQKGSLDFVKKLREHGFNPVEVETSEFMKSGGSVFCMKSVV